LPRRRPDVVHLITAKPALFGGWAAALTGRPALVAITGLGFAFSNDTALARTLRRILLFGYRTAIDRPGNHVIFQNKDDQGEFERAGLMRRAKFSMLSGSGTDLSVIKRHPLPLGRPVVALPARLLRDKGVLEFVEAARRLRDHPSRPIFRLIGDPDLGNPTSVTEVELRAWVREGAVEWAGFQADINAFLAQVHIVALPSYYREGFPKTLIDAAAAGRAAVTTDAPGCRDAVIDGVTGLLTPVRTRRRWRSDRVSTDDPSTGSRRWALRRGGMRSTLSGGNVVRPQRAAYRAWLKSSERSFKV
jgi:glycosyltransferase involved in cell wall biosynthesis